jgi:hypothetical protein
LSRRADFQRRLERRNGLGVLTGQVARHAEIDQHPGIAGQRAREFLIEHRRIGKTLLRHPQLRTLVLLRNLRRLRKKQE